jgi:hypothetical protein
MKIFYESFYPEVFARVAYTRSKPVPSRMLSKQERGIEETKSFQGQVRQNKLQGCTDTYLNVGNNPYQQSTSDMNAPRKRDCVVIRKIVGQRRLPYIQVPQSDAIYITIPNNEINLQEGDLLEHHVTEVHQQKVPFYPVKQQRVNESYGSCIETQPHGGTRGNSEPDAAMLQARQLPTVSGILVAVVMILTAVPSIIFTFTRILYMAPFCLRI